MSDFVQRPFKGSRNPVAQNVDPQGAPSSQKVEDALHLYPSKDNKDITTPEIPSDSVNQGLSGEPSSQEGPDHQLAVAELQGARDGMQNVGLLGGNAASMASTVVNTPTNLDAVDNFERTYLQPLKIVDAVLEKIANVWVMIVDRK
ncbi:hypothetical protein P692DRAFT_20714046 [Suillus brevipes Sb2]|nr:hypothetical protein P692DRAFT_20714046 [Suillus brevipes Sb2]